MRNCSVHSYTEMQTVVRLYLVLPVAVLGIAANTVNVLVFLNRQMRHAVINWFLLALSVSDLSLLLCTILFVSMPVVTTVDGNHWLWLVKLQIYFFRYGYPLGIISQTASVYYTTLVCVYRYIAICYPLRARQLTTKRSAKCAITVAAVFSVLMNVCRFWETDLELCVATQYGGAILTQITVSGLSAHAVYRVAYSTVGYPLIKSVLPFVVLMALTVLIKRAMRRSRRLHSQQRSISASAVIYATQRTAGPAAVLFRRPLSIEMGSMNQLQTPPLNRMYECRKQRTNANQSSIDDLSVGPRQIRRSPVSLQTTCTESDVTRRLRQKRSETLSVESTSREGRVTTMLLIIVGVFFFCNSVPFLNNLLEILLLYQPHLHRTFLSHLFRFGIEIGNLLVAFNSASTIVIYLTYSSKFVEALRSVTGGLSPESTPVVHCVPTTSINRQPRRQALLVKRSVPDDDGPSTTNGNNERIFS